MGGGGEEFGVGNHSSLLFDLERGARRKSGTRDASLRRHDPHQVQRVFLTGLKPDPQRTCQATRIGVSMQHARCFARGACTSPRVSFVRPAESALNLDAQLSEFATIRHSLPGASAAWTWNGLATTWWKARSARGRCWIRG